jgi:hypothetical protein
MAIIKQHSARPAADGQARPTPTPSQGPASPVAITLMGPADAGTATPLMGRGGSGTATPVMGPADSGTATPLMGLGGTGDSTPLMGRGAPSATPVMSPPAARKTDPQ